MGNRGSKSIVLDASNPFKGTIEESTIVKEQRVYGSWRSDYTTCLRYTLTGFERNSQVRVPSNQINIYTIRYYTSKVVQQCFEACAEKSHLGIAMNPWFITGFTGSEGCFFLSI